jgi:phytoene/squalene synthetase
VLRITENYSDQNILLSDKICSALQLINFWQDFSLDLMKNRVFIPMEYLAKYDLEVYDLFERKKTHNLNSCLNELYDRTEILLSEGSELIKYLKNLRLKLEIKATVLGGATILNKIRKLQANILVKRPKLSKTEFFLIFIKLFFKFW